MTIAEQQREQHQHQARPQQDLRAAAQNRASAAEQRNAAAAVKTAVTAAQVERTRARHLGADGRRLAEAFQVLFDQIEGREDMGVLHPGNVLRWGPGCPEEGTGNLAAVLEFVGRILAGELPHDAVEDMHEARLARHLSGAARHADSMYERAHRLESAAVVQPALPAAGVIPAQSNGHALPQRQVPPAPPEKPAEQTGKIALAAIEAMLAEGHEMPAAQAALVEHGYADEPAAFGPSALPHGRVMGDTQRLPVVPAKDDDSESAEAAPEPRPFSRSASTAGSETASSRGEESGSGADDDDES